MCVELGVGVLWSCLRCALLCSAVLCCPLLCCGSGGRSGGGGGMGGVGGREQGPSLLFARDGAKQGGQGLPPSLPLLLHPPPPPLPSF